MRRPHLRIKDFQRRKAYSPSSVLQVLGTDWEYIPIHPFASETEILEKLDMKPADCTSVDCYWHFAEDVAFLQVRSGVIVDDSELGLFARRSDDDDDSLTLHAVIRAVYITRTDFEDVMFKFAQLGLKGISENKHLRTKLQRVDGAE